MTTRDLPCSRNLPCSRTIVFVGARVLGSTPLYPFHTHQPLCADDCVSPPHTHTHYANGLGRTLMSFLLIIGATYGRNTTLHTLLSAAFPQLSTSPRTDATFQQPLLLSGEGQGACSGRMNPRRTPRWADGWHTHVQQLYQYNHGPPPPAACRRSARAL